MREQEIIVAEIDTLLMKDTRQPLTVTEADRLLECVELLRKAVETDRKERKIIYEQ